MPAGLTPPLYQVRGRLCIRVIPIKNRDRLYTAVHNPSSQSPFTPIEAILYFKNRLQTFLGFGHPIEVALSPILTLERIMVSNRSAELRSNPCYLLYFRTACPGSFGITPAHRGPSPFGLFNSMNYIYHSRHTQRQ